MRAPAPNRRPLATALGVAAFLCVAVARESSAQTPVTSGRSTVQEFSAAAPQTRAEVIDKERAEKLAELWPEQQNALVDLVNGWAERGLKEGLDTGKGSNGLQLTLPAYEQIMKASHSFNMLDARGAISVTERAAYIGRVRALAKRCCEGWLAGEAA